MTSVTTGSAALEADRAGPAGVDQRQLVTDGGLDGVHDGGAADGQVPDREPLDRTDRRRGVGQPGHLRLVEHDAHDVDAGPAGDHRSERAGVGGGVHRRSPDTQVCAEGTDPHLQGRVDVEAEAQRAAVRVRGPGGELDLRRVVDHEGDGAGGDRVGGEVVERGGVDAGVAQQDVVDPLRDQPECLAHGVAHDSGEPGSREDPLEDVPDADGLAGHADRRPGGPVDEVGGVRVEGVEVDDGQGRGQAARRVVETLAEGAGHAPAPASARASPATGRVSS